MRKHIKTPSHRKAPSPLTRRAIADQLRQLGLQAGDHVLVHSALTSFGRVAGGADTVIDALLDVVGPDGTVLAPTFESKDKVFDCRKSATNLGIIADTFWRRREAVRSIHPLASVAAIGRRATWFVENHVAAPTAHAEGTPYFKLYETGGKILLLGVDQDRSTFLHTAEELMRLPYLQPKAGTFRDQSGKVRTKSWSFFPGPHRDFIGLQKWLEDNGLVRKRRIGSCMAQLMECRPLLDALRQRLAQEPGLFISRNPNLPDGIWQQAAIRQARFQRESFTLAADSQFAGRYVEAMIESLKRAGIDQIVLSFVNRTAWDQASEAQRRWILRTLRAAKIKVAALKLPILNPARAAVLLKEAKTNVLVVPSPTAAGDVLNIASQGIRVCLENVAMAGAALARHIETQARSRTDIRAAFNPLAFAQVGENPFLHTYTKTRLKRHIGMLLVNDGWPTGQRTPLKEGLAEINELVSILRCRSFSGLMVLQAPDEQAFDATAAAFLKMLEDLGHAPADT